MRFRKLQLVAVALAIYGIYNVWMVVKYGQPLFLLWSTACFVGVVGLWFKQPWSRFVVYAVCSLTILGLFFYIGAMAVNGWPYPGLTRSVVALIPAALLVAICVWFMAITFRFFRAATERT